MPVNSTGTFGVIETNPFGRFLPLAGGALTGALGVPTGTTALPGLYFGGDTSSGLSGSTTGIAHSFSGSPRLTITSTLIRGGSGSIFAWSSGSTSNTSADTGLSRVGAGIVGVGTGAAGSVAGELRAAILSGQEITAPAAPAADGFRIFAQDNGAGKTQLMVIFASGAAQQIAIQP